MWRCNECKYFNDDWDESCAKCGGERVSAELPPPAAAEPADSAGAGKTTAAAARGAPAEAKSGSSLTDKLLMAVIAVVGIAIVAAAVIAWRMGLLAPDPGAGTPETGPVQATDSPEQPPAFSPPEDAIQPPERQTRLFGDQLDELYGYLNQLAVLAPEQDRDGLLSEADLLALAEFHDSGTGLVESYSGFEQRVVAAADPELGEYLDFMRLEFDTAFRYAIEALGRFRTADLGEMRPEYVLSDDLRQVAGQWGYLDSAILEQLWVEALQARQQVRLDLEYVEEYRQLEARIAALHEVHGAFNQSLKSMGQFTIRGGNLGADAENQLVAINEYAVLVEGLVFEFTQYSEQLAGLEQSERMEQLVDSFTTLAQDDHLFCFTECYKIYARDRNLKHPVYDSLAERFGFAQGVWPGLEMTYMGVAAKYEDDWIRMWRPDVYNRR